MGNSGEWGSAEAGYADRAGGGQARGNKGWSLPLPTPTD